MPWHKSILAKVREVCTCLGLLGVVIPLSGFWTIASALSVSPPERLQANSNQVPAGVLANNVLMLDLEAREGEWFPEDERGPSVKIFALAEREKPGQVPGPLIRVRANTQIHVSLHNLLSVELRMHGMHSRPGSEDDTLKVAPGETCNVSFQAGEPGAYYYLGNCGRRHAWWSTL